MENQNMTGTERPKIVVKIGSSSIIDNETGRVQLRHLAEMIENLYKFVKNGYHVVLVSSGSVGLGVTISNGKKPTSRPERQAYAALGQGRLMQVYSDLFSHYNQFIAQVLLTRDDLADEGRFNNAHNTISELFKRNIIPILNENDTTSTEGLEFSDNDNLAAMVAGMIHADHLVLLTDVDGLYDSNPHTNLSAKRIPEVDDVNEMLNQVNVKETLRSSWGTGGMATKMTAARLATAAGCNCIIMKARDTDYIAQIVDGDRSKGTVFTAANKPISKGKIFLSHGLRTQGSLHVDAGAAEAILSQKSLFAAGILRVEGEFESEDGVRLIDPNGLEVGIGLSNFKSDEIAKICKKQSPEIPKILGHTCADDCIVSQRNLAIMVPIN